MEKINYDNVVNELLKRFPEFKNSPEYFDESELESPYTVLGTLSLRAFENIDNRQDIKLAERLVQLTDEILNNPSSEDKSSNSEDTLVNLFQIEVFEKLVGSRTGALLAKKLLHGKSLELLEQTLKYYSTDLFLEEYRGKII